MFNCTNEDASRHVGSADDTDNIFSQMMIELKEQRRKVKKLTSKLMSLEAEKYGERTQYLAG